MSRRAVIRPEAEADLLDAMAWYKDQRPGLEDEFFLAFDASLSRILRTPKSFPVVHAVLPPMVRMRAPPRRGAGPAASPAAQPPQPSGKP